MAKKAVRPAPGMRERPDQGANRTELALMARGIDSDTAYDINAKKLTLAALKQMDARALRKLGLKSDAIANLHGEGRPPIPPDKLIQVLFDNRFMCCVCREPERPVIVHHIRKWSKTRDHEPNNLCVLCDIHHGEAHSTHELSQNLDAAKLRRLKAKWEGEVKKLDIQAILENGGHEGTSWVYFNHQRIFRMAEQARVDLTGLRAFRRGGGIHDADGQLLSRLHISNYMYDGGDGNALYRYVEQVFHALLEKLSALNISDKLDRVLLKEVLREKMLIVVSGAHYFTGKGESTEGPGQTAEGHRSANKVKVTFSFDKWEATSNSAKHVWLTGHQDVTSIVRVGRISSDAGILVIQGTVLGIAQGMENIKTREYATFPYRRGVYVLDEEDEDIDEDWLDED